MIRWRRGSCDACHTGDWGSTTGGARVIVVKLADTKRCYILPSRLAQDSPRKQFEIVPEPLSKAIGVHFAGQEGWNFCNSLPMYLLEESKKSSLMGTPLELKSEKIVEFFAQEP
ncbi:hypothetical protein Q1695_000213 [Nippostrongylus brasiliensis]|nr:hypothetical protein Q1695_000213 [Nippostrongylus brasiliensis]